MIIILTSSESLKIEPTHIHVSSFTQNKFEESHQYRIIFNKLTQKYGL
jgi:hypothetical protein